MSWQYPIGQSVIKQMFKTSLDRNRLAHAFLFWGPSGVGKDAMAISLALSLNCMKHELGGCCTCSACRQILNMENPNIRFIVPLPTRPKAMKEETYIARIREQLMQRISNPYEEFLSSETTTLPVIGIDSIREMKRDVMLKVMGSGTRVMIVSHAECMTPSAANSLLKILEEPPQKTIIVLTTSQVSRLLETVVSRCQAVRFPPLQQGEIFEALIDNFGIERTRANLLSKMSGGSLQRALILNNEQFLEQRQSAVKFLEESLKADTFKRIELMDELTQKGDRKDIQEILRLLILWLRDLLQFRLGSQELILNMDSLEVLARWDREWPGLIIEKCIHCVERAVDLIEKSVYLSVVVFSLSQELALYRGK